MPRPDFWFEVVPSFAVIPLILVFFIGCARFIPYAIRRRDWGMMTALVVSYALLGCVLNIAIDNIASARLW